VVISDPMEVSMPRLGLVTFEDLETGDVLEVDTAGPEWMEFTRNAARLMTDRTSALRRMQLDLVEVRTDRPYVDALVAFFEARSRRLAHR
jgi:hypothetical protein